MSLSLWDNDDFVRLRNPVQYAELNRRNIALKYSKVGECVWCGKLFLKKHHKEKYCSERCRKDSRGHQSRMKSHRYYHKHKFEMSEKQRFGLGSGTLGQHSYKDFDKESTVVRKEMKRLRLKKGY